MVGMSTGQTPPPLAGRCIVITRPRAQATAWMEELRRLGAEPFLCPTVEVVPPPDWTALDDALARLPQFDWVVFTSGNGVRFFCQRCERHGQDLRALRRLRVAAVGPQTAQALQRRGVRVDFMPPTYQAEGLLSGFKRRRLRGKQVLLPRAALGRAVLATALRDMGAVVTDVAVYHTIQPRSSAVALHQRLQGGAVDMLTLTSSSAVQNLQAMLGPEHWPQVLDGVAIACIGPVTAETARVCGLQVAVQPAASTIAALTAAMVAYYQGQGQKISGQKEDR
jgi:uroporphyrinogen III methyltransferase/synthase